MNFCVRTKIWLLLGAASGASSVLLGAYGAHGLEEIFSDVPRKRTAYGNAVDYQMIHSLLLVVLGLFGSKNKPGGKLFFLNASLLSLSILLFSGSIYLWVFGGSDWLLKLTPAGGIGFVLSWILIGFQVRPKDEK